MTTAFRDHPRLRDATRRQITSAMDRRLAALGVPGQASHAPSSGARLYAAYRKALGDSRSTDGLEVEWKRKIQEMQERGFDLGYDDDSPDDGSSRARARVDGIYANARAALYAIFDVEVLRGASPRHLLIHSTSLDREDYLAHPATGERIRPDDARKIQACFSSQSPRVQLVISDGLNANAVNENLGAVLRGLKQGLGTSDTGHPEIAIENGRVRAGYLVGELTGAECVVHLIGERPGTGINALSAYITYGLEPDGRPRWSADLDHSATTAICGIHKRGKPPDTAVDEILRCIGKILDARCSGVKLQERTQR